MFNKMLGLTKEGSMRKTAVILLIALFVVFCSVGVYAQQITKVDKEKFDKLTPEQKEKFVEMAKEAQKTAQESVKDYEAVAKEAERSKKACEIIAKTAVEAEIAAVASVTGPIGAVIGTGAVAAVETVYNNLTKDDPKK
ncbi:MAG: hypothetical protein NT166_08570 [Candidatus Aminicenantes bacterium]|nr:hypothetical protein [Candidatus Aminicenantes bacterium]